MSRIINAAAAVAAISMGAAEPVSAQGNWTLAGCIRDADKHRDDSIRANCASLRAQAQVSCRNRWTSTNARMVESCRAKAEAIARRARPRR